MDKPSQGRPFHRLFAISCQQQGNEFVINIKDTSVLVVISVVGTRTFTGNTVATQTTNTSQHLRSSL